MTGIYIQKKEKGFSTIEILVAMAVLVISVSGIFLLSFAGQSMMVDSQINSEALTKTQELLEQEQALARKDFKLVCPTSSVDGIYEKKIDVSNSSNPSDFFTKKVTATVSWKGEYNRDLSVTLSGLVTNFENAVGGDTCSTFLTGDWSAPDVSDFFVANLNSAASYPSVSVDAYNQKVYAAISDANDPDAPTLFVYDISSNPSSPVFIGSLDNSAGVMAGINAIHAADKYIYAAKNTGPGSGQLQIFDIAASNPVQLGSDFKVFGVTGTGDQGIGDSIFYKDGYVYLGLTTTDSGPEFHIIDVHNPEHPSEVGYWPSSGNLSNSINDIYVKDGYAYLAHPTDSSSPYNEEITVLDITDPTNPQRVGGYDAPDDAGHGKSFYFVGDNLYFGRTVTASNQEFEILNDSDQANISQTGSQEISSSVNDILVRDYLTFLITGNRFQIWKTNDQSDITSYYSRSLSGGTSLDCEGNYLYVGSVSLSDEGYLYAITAH
jgi:Tfp pilus assembly protein PilV